MRLKDEWSRRALSPVRDFFVASGPGWDDPAEQVRSAKVGVDFFLTGLDPRWLARCSVLEIGCGNGRLVHHLRPLVRDYTGIDIAAGMVEEARRRCADYDGVRFFECDGLAVPVAAADREYGFIVSAGAFIHCPKDVIGSLVRSAWALAAPGARMRYQVYADLTDPTGLDPTVDWAALHRAATAQKSDAPAESEALIADHYFEGHRFRVDEARAYFERCLGARVELHRPTPMDVWVDVRRSAGA